MDLAPEKIHGRHALDGRPAQPVLDVPSAGLGIGERVAVDDLANHRLKIA